MNSSLQLFSDQKKKEWFAVAIIAAISIAIRLHTNFSMEYIPGGNGAYYLIMVRSFLEKGKLIHADFPMLFWLESGLAFAVYKLGLANFNSAIDTISRLFDSIVPVLSIVPVYLFTKKILKEKHEWNIPVVISSISVIYYSFLILTSEFQKNSLGLLWLSWLLYYLLLVHEESTVKNVFGVSLFLTLTGLTHYGCIAVGVTIIFISLLIHTLFQFNLKRNDGILFVLILSIVAAMAIMFVILPYRFKTFIQIPLEIFNNPILFMILRKEPILAPADVLSLMFMNILAVSAIVSFIKKYDEIAKKHRSFFLSMIILLLFLSSPFLSYEYAQRVYFISYLVAIPVLAFLYNLMKDKEKKIFFTLIIPLIILSSVIIVISKPNYSNMNRNLYAEMLKLKTIVKNDDKTILVARHGMEFWSTWILEDLAVKQEQLTLNYWRNDNNIYFIQQKKDKPPFGPAGTFGNSFPEPKLPENSYQVFCGEYFDLYKSPTPPKDFNEYNNKVH